MRASRGAVPGVSVQTRARVESVRTELGDPRAVVRYSWVQELTGATGERIANAFSEVDELLPLERHLRAEHRSGGRPHYAQFRAPLELYALVRLLKPRHIVETGVSSGVSSAHFLLGLKKVHPGTLHSIDQPLHQRGKRFGATESPVALPPGRRTGWAIPPELTSGWDLRIGSSESLLPPLVKELDSVGIFLHDSRHTPGHLTFELETVRPKLSASAIVLADNTVWTGQAFPKFARSVGRPMFRRARSDLVGLSMP